MVTGFRYSQKLALKSPLAGALAAMAILMFPPALRLSFSAPAQTEPSSVIESIHASGSKNYSEMEIIALTALKPGTTVTRERLQATANFMAQTGLFSTVNYRFTSAGQGINVEFQVADAPMAPVWFDNFPWFSDAELNAAVRMAVPLFKGFAPLGGSILDDITQALTLLLQSNKISATVEHLLVAKPASDEQVMDFKVNGPRLSIASLSFTDSLAQDSPKLAGHKSDIVGKPFSRFAIEMFLQEQVRPLYLASGHLQVNFKPPEPRFTGDPNLPLPSEVSVTVPVEPGPAYRLGSIAWSGNSVLTAAQLDPLLTIKRGDLADGMVLEDFWRRVQREYARRGYMQVKITPQPQYSAADSTVSYRVEISEGPQFRMGQLVVTGLSLDAERSLRASWKLMPGQIFDGAYVEDMLVKLEKPTPDIFGRLPIHYSQLGHLIEPGDAPGTMNVMLDFQR